MLCHYNLTIITSFLRSITKYVFPIFYSLPQLPNLSTNCFFSAAGKGRNTFSYIIKLLIILHKNRLKKSLILIIISNIVSINCAFSLPNIVFILYFNSKPYIMFNVWDLKVDNKPLFTSREYDNKPNILSMWSFFNFI